MYLLLPTFNRPEYVVRSLESLSKTIFPEGTTLLISDDCSSDERTKNALVKLDSDLHASGVNVTTCLHSTRGGAEWNMRFLFKTFKEKTDDQFALMLNDDMVYNKNWLVFTIKKMQELLQDKYPVGMFSCFNTKTHQFVGEPRIEGVGTKEVVGACCTCINRDLVDVSSSGLIDWEAAKNCYIQGKQIYCSYDSYVDHIGIHGVNSGSVGDADVASNFVGE